MTKHNQRRRWLRWYSSHFWSSRPYPNHKRIAIFREFRSYFQSFPLCGEYFMWHFLYFAQFRWWESTSYKWSYGAPKRILWGSALFVDPKKQKTSCLPKPYLGFQPPPHKASEGFHGSGAHLEGLWVWQVGSKAQDRTGESGQGLGGLRPRGGVDVGTLLVWWSCHNFHIFNGNNSPINCVTCGNGWRWYSFFWNELWIKLRKII